MTWYSCYTPLPATYCAFEATISAKRISIGRPEFTGGRTLDISNALVQDLLQEPWILQLLLDLADDRVRELFLLPLLDLVLVAHP